MNNERAVKLDWAEIKWNKAMFDLRGYLKDHKKGWREQPGGSAEWVLVDCPCCNGIFTVGIHKFHKGWRCTECQEKGDLEKYIAYTDHINRSDALNTIEKYAERIVVKKRKLINL
jgi:hypothetical protein